MNYKQWCDDLIAYLRSNPPIYDTDEIMLVQIMIEDIIKVWRNKLITKSLHCKECDAVYMYKFWIESRNKLRCKNCGKMLEM